NQRQLIVRARAEWPIAQGQLLVDIRCQLAKRGLMPRALVTGASGFIGSHLCELLLRRGYEVVGLVRPTSDIHALQRLSIEFPDRFGLVIGDTTDRADLNAAVRGVDFIFHLAAKVMGTSE